MMIGQTQVESLFHQIMQPSRSHGHLSVPPVFRPTANKKYNVRIVLVDIERNNAGKINFIDKGQMYVPVTEAFANVNHITSEVKQVYILKIRPKIV